MPLKRTALICVFVSLLAFAAYFFIAFVILQWRLSLAIEQNSVFNTMLSRSAGANSVEAAQYLEYLINYYPSGTRQVSGSKVDMLVESLRRCCAIEIIKQLRMTTGKDLGNDPEAWINAYAHPVKE